MSTIPEIKARLLEPGTPFTAVMGATKLAQVKDRPAAQLPVAYVLIAREASGENTRGFGAAVLQRQERDIMVVIVAENLAGAMGDEVSDDLEELKTFVRSKLVGFVPVDMQQCGEPIIHIGGEVVEAVSGCVWFEDTFSAPTYLKETT